MLESKSYSLCHHSPEYGTLSECSVNIEQPSGSGLCSRFSSTLVPLGTTTTKKLHELWETWLYGSERRADGEGNMSV